MVGVIELVCVIELMVIVIEFVAVVIELVVGVN